ncbi:MAG: hypothetical protein LBD29_03930 [Treponema sp.]|jgi:uncharacterized integral membrane protein|nr:hypothetical protein [Treponema sp.]
MPWRLVGFIIIFAVFLIFILSNLGNKCDISFINPEWTLKEVPVFLTVFGSFMVGLLSAIPLIISAHIRGKKGGQDKPKKGNQRGAVLDKDGDQLNGYGQQ